jgi:hypothetical protein
LKRSNIEQLQETNPIAADIQALSAKQVAQILNKIGMVGLQACRFIMCSTYRGGSLIFTRDNLERILNADKRTNGQMESNVQNQRKTASKNIRNQGRGKKMGNRGKKPS